MTAGPHPLDRSHRARSRRGTLRSLAARAIGRARRLGRRSFAVAAARSAPGPLEAVARAPVAVDRALLLGRRLEIGAAGAVAVIEASGPGRFDVARGCAAALFASLEIAPDVPMAARPRLVGGFAFAPEGGGSEWGRGFPGVRVVLPERMWARERGQTWLTVAVAVEPDDDVDDVARRIGAATERTGGSGSQAGIARHHDPERVTTEDTEDGGPSADGTRTRFEAAVARAVERIGRGELTKVVVARTARIASRTAIDPVAVARRLRAAEPAALVYLVAPSGGGPALAGATPELLVRRRGARLGTMALAGSRARGRSEVEDSRLDRGLAASAKDIREHLCVVDAIGARLDGLGARVRVGPRRSIALAHVRHLRTPIAARMRQHKGALDLAAALHPTPAVAGLPLDAALAHLGAEEGMDRGWYAGAVGWIDAAGDGELHVALRAARILGCRATLFAGAGIVAGSEPAAEWAETEAKLRALAGAIAVGSRVANVDTEVTCGWDG